MDRFWTTAGGYSTLLAGLGAVRPPLQLLEVEWLMGSRMAMGPLENWRMAPRPAWVCVTAPRMGRPEREL